MSLKRVIKPKLIIHNFKFQSLLQPTTYLNVHKFNTYSVDPDEPKLPSIRTMFKVLLGLGILAAGASVGHYLMFPNIYLYPNEIRSNIRYGLFYKNHKKDFKLALTYLTTAQHQLELDDSIYKNSWLYLGILFEISQVYILLKQYEQSNLMLKKILESKWIDINGKNENINKEDISKLLELNLLIDDNLIQLNDIENRKKLWKDIETTFLPLLKDKNILSVDEKVNFLERLAQFNLDIKSYSTAIKVYKIVIDLNKDVGKQLTLKNNLAVSLSNFNRFVEANNEFQNLIVELNNNKFMDKELSYTAYSNLADNFEASGDTKNMKRTLKTMLKLKNELELDVSRIRKIKLKLNE